MLTHQELHADGTPMGRDPRRMNAAALEACGLERQSRGDAIRAKCTECMAGSQAEVRRCGDVSCALWPFRMGTNPWPEKRVMSEEQRALAVERLSRARANG